MAIKKRKRQRAPGGGRKPLPPEKRAERRITVRLYETDSELLDRLCEQLGLSETAVIRRALHDLADKIIT